MRALLWAVTFLINAAKADVCRRLASDYAKQTVQLHLLTLSQRLAFHHLPSEPSVTHCVLGTMLSVLYRVI